MSQLVCNTITVDVFMSLDAIAEEILLMRNAREEREFTEAAAAPPQPVELYIPSSEVGMMKKAMTVMTEDRPTCACII